jgi:hypothetical protein
MVLVEGNNHKQLMTQERLREKRMKQRHKAAVAFSEQDARERRSGTRSWRGREMLQRSASESEIGRVGMANAMEGWRRCKAGRRPSCASSFALQLVTCVRGRKVDTHAACAAGGEGQATAAYERLASSLAVAVMPACCLSVVLAKVLTVGVPTHTSRTSPLSGLTRTHENCGHSENQHVSSTARAAGARSGEQWRCVSVEGIG